MGKPEQKLQIQVANYCKLRYPHLLWTISPAGLIINRNLGMLSVRLGYRKGTPDLLFFEPRGAFHGLVIELKDINGSVSDEQREFIALASEKGYATAVCWTYEETIKTLDNYLNLAKGGRPNDEDQASRQGIQSQTAAGGAKDSAYCPVRASDAPGCPEDSQDQSPF